MLPSSPGAVQERVTELASISTISMSVTAAGDVVSCIGAALTVKPPVLVAVPPGVVTETSLTPVAAEPEIEMLAVICVALFTVKELTVMPEPKLTEVAPV